MTLQIYGLLTGIEAPVIETSGKSLFNAALINSLNNWFV